MICTHIAIQKPIGGKVVDWMEPVSDQQYSARAASKRSTSLDPFRLMRLWNAARVLLEASLIRVMFASTLAHAERSSLS
jgi:hypothetical protein